MKIINIARFAGAGIMVGTLLAGCGDSSSSANPAGGSSAGKPVNIKAFAFDPAGLTIPVGTAVTWTNQDPTIHTATSVQGAAAAFDSGNLDKGKTFTFTFAKAGSYPYHCAIHSNMMGSVTVQ
ncbi:MAG: cupredoxin domain-containing protein [Actinobacteria bacterium]|nr:cupredoxin domain-containing protein [Actinomycetota bacterium]